MSFMSKIFTKYIANIFSGLADLPKDERFGKDSANIPSIPIPDYVILKDKTQNDFLKKNGYIALPMLNEEQVSQFRELYKKWHPIPPDTFYKSYFNNNAEYKQEVEKTIIRHCTSKLEDYFEDYDPFGAMFVVKPAGNKGHIPPHQDWGFVDETKHWSLNMWLPIQDVGERNGTMRFLAGSHFFMETIRGSGTPDLYDHLINEIEPHLVDVPLKAGEAVFFYHGIVHCSHENKKEDERVCLGISLVQKNVPIYFNFLSSEKKELERYLANKDFYMNYTPNRDKLPENIMKVESHAMNFTLLTPKELENKILAIH